MKRYVIGLDIGTTSAKAVAVAQDGSMLAQANAGYALLTSGCRVEQRPQDWIDASIQILRTVTDSLPDALPAGLSLSTQGATTTAVDAAGSPIGNAITWMDTRATREAGEIEAALGAEYIYRRSGWRVSPSLDAAKIRHMRGDPAYDGAAMFLSTIEIMNAWLTGRAVIDPSNAAIRQLFDVEGGCWDDRLIGAAGITRENLAEVLPSGALVGGLCAHAAAQTGLPAGLPVFNGAHDQYCAAIGAGAVSEGDVLLSAGTAWVLLGITAAPLYTPSYIAPGKHPVAGLYGAMASLSCSGASLQWFKNGFLPDGFEEINHAVAKRRGRTGDLFFYPYLAGANYPVWKPDVRGMFAGLSLEHDRFDLACAIMEGVAFSVRRGVDDLTRQRHEHPPHPDHGRRGEERRMVPDGCRRHGPAG